MVDREFAHDCMYILNYVLYSWKFSRISSFTNEQNLEFHNKIFTNASRSNITVKEDGELLHRISNQLEWNILGKFSGARKSLPTFFIPTQRLW